MWAPSNASSAIQRFRHAKRERNARIKKKKHTHQISAYNTHQNEIKSHFL